jgi:hypothetical protein
LSVRYSYYEKQLELLKMGCGPSIEEPAGGGEAVRADPNEGMKASAIDKEMDKARQAEELKVKLLLLGAGESGKSTIFKQMRILYGAPPKDDDLRMYGVVMRSNVITAMRKLCGLLRTLELEDTLGAEPATDIGKTPKECYDVIVANLIDYTADPEQLPPPENFDQDWVGESARAGFAANSDAKIFMQLIKEIKCLWEVRIWFFIG